MVKLPGERVRRAVRYCRASCLYHRLAEELPGCQLVYRELFRYALKPGFVDQIRQATNGNVVLGNDRFGEEIAKMLGKRVSRGSAGRPWKVPKK